MSSIPSAPAILGDYELPGRAQPAPAALVEVARSPMIGYLQVLGARLAAEGIESLIVNEHSNGLGPQFADVAGGARLLVALPRAPDAREIIALVARGAFALGDGDPCA